ncbi:protein kinase domain-containing protein [Catellatospora tritici]|uniref:protein kinase domain-containing protein n=1 Tax=Catellatospora tritici TaxID=2851566 RepID=UPI001C2DE7D6|nr:protein kinase [Catellatospora tritici]MBV1853561.1 protein kinase [Catellatospora tritici]
MLHEGELVVRRYLLETVIGVGGMGRVWRATDQLLGRTVAVKELFAAAGETGADEVVARAAAEATAAARLSHAAIVTVHDVIVDTATPLIVMQYVPGDSLQQYVERHGPMSPDHAARVGISILDALGHAHSQHVLHRDVKPSNVLITAQGQIFVTDFSIARVVPDTSRSHTGLAFGSPGYVAPERIVTGRVGAEGDYFGLGAVLYFLVEGGAPFSHTDPMVGMFASASRPHTPPVNAGTAGLAEAIEGLLVKDPRERMRPERARELLLAASRDAAADAAPRAVAADPVPAPAPAAAPAVLAGPVVAAAGPVGDAGSDRPARTPVEAASAAGPDAPPPIPHPVTMSMSPAAPPAAAPPAPPRTRPPSTPVYAPAAVPVREARTPHMPPAPAGAAPVPPPVPAAVGGGGAARPGRRWGLWLAAAAAVVGLVVVTTATLVKLAGDRGPTEPDAAATSGPSSPSSPSATQASLADRYAETVLAARPLDYFPLRETTQDMATNQASATPARFHDVRLAAVEGPFGPQTSAPSFADTNGGPAGRTRFVELPRRDSFVQGKALTVSMWFRASGPGVLYGTSKKPLLEYLEFGLEPSLYVGTDGLMHAGYYDTGTPGLPVGSMTSLSKVDDGRWHHVALSRSADGMTEVWYLDGAQAGSRRMKGRPGYLVPSYAYVGAGKWSHWVATSGDVGTFAGAISDFAYFDRVLSREEIAAQYAAAHG